MLVKVIKQTQKTITTKEVFYVESDSIENATDLISTTGCLSGHYTEKESEPKQSIYGVVADFTGYAKILLKRDGEEHIIYSPTLDKNDIKVAMLEQIPDLEDFHSYDVSILEAPTLSDWDIKAKQIRDLLAAIPEKNHDEDTAIYDEKYFQFVDWLDKNG
ncbi:hypothetical protein [Burkholderia cenocepacia]|uniref:Uncharacterized protein n=1 Tax=Burkholderia cenocepacia TaxID=95486 RepID=A0ABD4UD93_9BURK|nr:hypothetical protein [Burkholderia cenocepacia]MCW3498695.1 hypothetical protein [Burkholderia cenocepacia]MCW3506217.1 hypothetical protein [Burkholderia cenocepacia]MCW3513848.1 hypothetical protein [Burkholderia cenocepacia]MCW3528998.1 hypothetical protein [Burkholderia cenocepacia]MCW3544668.1 hypothetical protein [Burkholderia cenocepacia]